MTHASKNILVNKILSSNDSNLLDAIATLISEHERGRYWITLTAKRQHFQAFYVKNRNKLYLGYAGTREEAKLICEKHERSFRTETIESSLNL